MSKKRFEIKPNVNSIGLPQGSIIIDNLTGKKGFSLEELVILANELEDSINILKKELSKYNGVNCKNCMYYACDGAGDYCTSDHSPIGVWSMFPFGWDYQKEAENCKEYTK